MKKVLFLFVTFSFLILPTLGAVFGTYKAETDYGIIDGFKWNFFNRDGKPFVELKSETKEEQERLEREKNKPKEVQDDVQLYRFMIDNTVAF